MENLVNLQIKLLIKIKTVHDKCVYEIMKTAMDFRLIVTKIPYVLKVMRQYIEEWTK